MRIAPVTIMLLISLAAASQAAARVIHVDITNVTYAPTHITAQVGDIIEWNNTDFVAHTATARDKAWDITLPPGKTGRTILKAAGHREYYCKYHPTMVGTLDVTGK